MVNSFNSSANSDQLQAIQTTEGALLIIAGPGSGKTFTLVERIVYLITHQNVTPESLLVVTFTEKAASELTTRISNRLNQLGIRFNLNEMFLGTFHSICLRWLENYREFTRLKRNFMMMDQFDQQYFLYQRLNDYQAIANLELVIGEKQQKSWDQTATLLRWLNTVSEEGLEAQTLINGSHEAVQVLGQCYQLYQQQLEEENALDFSTIQYEAYKLLINHPQVLTQLQSKINYLMVDEYQDTNTIQEKILTLLAGKNPNLCVVGDDDQGLYRFRGATIRNILEFKNKFPQGQCQQVTLSINYRSHPDIIDFYNRWMNDQDWEVNHKLYRYSKQIKPRLDQFSAVPSVIKVSGVNEAHWQEEILDFLHSLKTKGNLSDWNQVAFLFRSVKNEKVVALAQYLEANGISVYSPRSNQFFEREEIKLMLGALIFIFPQFPKIRKWNDEASLEIWDYYDNDCFRLFAEQLKKSENQDLLKWCRSKAKQHLFLTENTNYAFTGLFYELLQFPLFSQYLDEKLLQKKGIIHSRAMRNLALFSQLLGKFEYLNNINVFTPKYLDSYVINLFNQFIRFLQEGGIDEYEDEAEYAPSGCVSFLTIHQSKGLEFPVVIVGSLNAVPRKQYTELNEILEHNYYARPPFEPIEEIKNYDFYRLYYTAYSRAQNLLVLTCVEKQGRGKTPSKYFSNYYQELLDWKDERIILSQLPLEKVKDVNLKREYSFTSHLTLYENCAEQYRFLKELEFAPIRNSPILFGTLVHQTIEDIHHAVLRGEESTLNEEKISGWFDTNYAYLTKRERVYLAPAAKFSALKQVLNYYRRRHGNWLTIKEAEVDVSLVKDEYILAGSIDLIEGENQTVEIIDFKSEKKLDINNLKDREKLNRYRRQLEVYAHIVEQRTGLKVSKTHLYYTSVDDGNPYISFEVNPASINATIKTFDEVVSRIESKDFRIKERPVKICKDCDLKYYCDVKNWQFRE